MEVIKLWSVFFVAQYTAPLLRNLIVHSRRQSFGDASFPFVNKRCHFRNKFFSTKLKKKEDM